MFVLTVDFEPPSISLPQNFNGHRNLKGMVWFKGSTSIGSKLPLTQEWISMGSTYKIIKTKSLFAERKNIYIQEKLP